MMFFFISVLSLISVSAFAQNVTVKGQIMDAATGDGIPFATVLIKGTTTGMESDADGFYTITVGSKDILVFNAVGYAQVEEPVNGRAMIDVELKTDSEFLDETIVVAYGVQKKSSFVGSAAQVSGEKLERMQTTNISKSLEGAVAGLQTSSSSEHRDLPPISSSADSVRCRHQSLRFW